MIAVAYKPAFIRQLKKLPKALQAEAIQKVELFKNPKEHKVLGVHKLHGNLKDTWSFSVNYRYRIIFIWETRNTSAILLAIGDHSLYS